MAGEPPIKSGNGYRFARIGTAAALTGVLVVLLVIDAVSPDYSISYLTLTALLAAISGLLGVEVLATIFGRKQ